SRRVQRNGMFVALRGEKSDGHQFIGQAIEKGASVIVAEREGSHPRATFLVVENTRAALADLSAAFYHYPARKLKLAAVTGTKGKTLYSTRCSAEKTKTDGSCEYRRPVWRAASRQDRQECRRDHLWQRRARGFSRFKSSRRVQRHLLSARSRRQKLPGSRSAHR